MADAEYAIDVAARMPGGQATLAELDELSSKLMAGGKNSTALSQGISRVAKQLDEAKASALAANTELVEVEKHFLGLQKESRAAEAAVAKYAAKAGDWRSAFDPEHLAQLKANSDRVSASLATQAARLALVKGRSKDATAAEAHHATSLANLRTLSNHVNGSFARQAERLGKVQAALAQTGGPVGGLASRAVGAYKAFGEMNGALGASRAAGLAVVAVSAALTVGLVLLTVAVVAGTLALTAWAVKQADAARSANLTRQAIALLHPELAGLDFKGTAAATGVAEDRLYALSKSLKAAGLRGGDLSKGLTALATAEGALGAEGSDHFLKQLQSGQKGVDALAGEVQSKFGGIVAQKLRGLDAQSAKLTKNLGGLFDDLDIEPVLSAMSILVGLFDETTASGKAIRFLGSAVFSPLIAGAERAALVVEAFALGVMIGLLKLYIWAKPAIKKIKDLFSISDDTFEGSLYSITTAAKVLTVGLGLLLVPFVALAAVFVLMTAAPVAVLAAFVALGYGIAAGLAWLGGKIGDFFTWVSELDMGQIASDLIDGFVKGILGGLVRVASAMSRLASTGVDAAKSALGIHSPSTVMAGVADDTADGYQSQIERRTPGANEALESMVAPRAEQGSIADRGFGGSSGGGPAFDFTGAQFVFHGVANAEQAEQRFGDMLTRLIEGDAATLTGSLGEAPA